MYNSRDTSSSDPRITGHEDNTDLDESDLRVNKRNLQFLIITCCLGSFLIGYSLTISNMVFQIVLDNTKDQALENYVYSSLFTSMAPLGGSIGCMIIVSKVFQMGRRIILIIADVFAITGCIICMNKGNYIEISGMFILGLAVGINTIMIPMYLMEYAPCFSGKGRVIITHHFFMIFGIAISFLWGLFIKEENIPPPPTGFASLAQENHIKNADKYQIVIYLIPLIFAVLRTAILLFYYKKDTPFFYLLKNQKEKARLIIYQYYNEEQAEKLLEIFEVKQARQMEGSTKLKDMLQLRYRRRVGISCLMNFFCYFSGVFYFLLYSEQALDELEGTKNVHISNQYRTLIIGLVLLFTQFSQIFFAKFMGRKTILLIGQSLYILGFLGLASIENFQFTSYLDVVTVFMGIVCIGFCFQSSVIPVILNEILPERGVAAAHSISLFSITIGAFIYPFLIEYQFIFSINQCCFNVLGFLVLLYLVKETRGLTNFQIEKLYTQNFHGLIKDPEESDGDISRNLLPQQI